MSWPGEKILIRLIDTLEKGIGGALLPWQTRRVSKANAEARALEFLLLKQAELDVEELKAGRKKIDASGKLVVCDTPKLLGALDARSNDESPPESRSLNRMEFAVAARTAADALDMQRAINLKKISLYAEEEAEELDNKSPTTSAADSTQSKKVDDDWFAKWRTGAQEVSREEMQRLWGKLLAAEVAEPGSYTLHTVDFLSRMSTSEAELLARVAPFVTDSGIIRVGDDFFKSHNLNFSDFLFLNDLGLLNGIVGVGGLQATLGRSHFNGRAMYTLVSGRQALVFDMGDVANSPPELKFEVFTLTRVCQEILTLTNITTDPAYLQKISEQAISKGAVEVKIGNVHSDGRRIIQLRTIAINPAEQKTDG